MMPTVPAQSLRISKHEQLKNLAEVIHGNNPWTKHWRQISTWVLRVLGSLRRIIEGAILEACSIVLLYTYTHTHTHSPSKFMLLWLSANITFYRCLQGATFRIMCQQLVMINDQLEIQDSTCTLYLPCPDFDQSSRPRH